MKLWCGKAGCVVVWFGVYVVRLGVLGPGMVRFTNKEN